MRARAVLLLLLFGCFGILPLGAQEASKRADIKALLRLTGAQELGIRVSLQVIERFRRVNTEVPEWVWQEILQEARAKADDFIEDTIVPIYDRYLTHEDIKGLLAFYQSPLGQKLRSVMPLMSEESRIAGQAWGRLFAEELRKKLAERGYK